VSPQAAEQPLTPRQRSIVDHLLAKGLVEKRAKRFARKYAGMRTLDEFRALAHLGAIEAGLNFDDAFEVPVEQYGKRRIDGAMFDGLREDERFTRPERLVRIAACRHGGELHDDFNSLKADRKEVARRLDEITQGHVVSMLAALMDDAEQGAGGEAAFGEREALLRFPEAWRKVQSALSDDERHLLDRLRAGREMTEIQSELGVTYKVVRGRRDHLKRRLAELFAQEEVFDLPDGFEGTLDGPDEPGSPEGAYR
jgi:DNA-directed RNA polymerase specialized sigma subunit